MEDFADRYGVHFVKLVDSRETMKEFEFDKTLLMPTAGGYRALVEQAGLEIKPRIKKYLSKRWSEGAIENLSFFAMAVAVYARSVSDPPCEVNVGKALLRTAAFCNRRCAYRKETGGGCRMAMNHGQHHLPKCIKLPRDVEIIWRCLKTYIATGKAISVKEALSVQDAMSIRDAMIIKIDIGSDFAPAASC